MDVPAHAVQVFLGLFHRPGDIPVAVKFPIFAVVTGREGEYAPAKAHQVLGLAGKDQNSRLVVAVVQRPDADGVTGGDIAAGSCVKEDEGKLRIQHGEHIRAVFFVQGQQHLAVGAAGKGIALGGELRLELLKAIDLAVAHQVFAVQLKGLHTLAAQAHDGQAVKAHEAHAGVNDAAVVRPPGFGGVKMLLELFKTEAAAAVTHYRTHNISPVCRCPADNSMCRGTSPPCTGIKIQHPIGQVLPLAVPPIFVLFYAL